MKQGGRGCPAPGTHQLQLPTSSLTPSPALLACLPRWRMLPCLTKSLLNIFTFRRALLDSNLHSTLVCEHYSNSCYHRRYSWNNQCGAKAIQSEMTKRKRMPTCLKDLSSWGKAPQGMNLQNQRPFPTASQPLNEV